MGISKRNLQLAAVTNGADDTYYYYVPIGSWRFAGFQCILNGGSGSVTVTVEATSEPATALASAAWADITSEVFGVANLTATGNLLFDLPAVWRALRVKVVASTGAADDADWTINCTLMD